MGRIGVFSNDPPLERDLRILVFLLPPRRPSRSGFPTSLFCLPLQQPRISSELCSPRLPSPRLSSWKRSLRLQIHLRRSCPSPRLSLLKHNVPSKSRKSRSWSTLLPSFSRIRRHLRKEALATDAPEHDRCRKRPGFGRGAGRIRARSTESSPRRRG